ncbi:MAG TPA: hypothetical protein VFE16_09415 [Candidatus Cybelea sp.]|jgi:hypothetical protein|nr:hypothetical protein [Candidatus Cybelea sp.]
MNYVEWLRVRNLLKIVAIVLVVLVALAVVLRVSVSRYMSPDAWVSHISMDPGVKITRSVLPDGTKRVIMDDPNQDTHVVIDDFGYKGKHIVVTEPTKRAHSDHSHISVGSIRVIETNHGNTTTTVIDTNGAVPMIYYMAIADVVALIVATILAAPLAREMDGHLEVALTRPCSRLRFALEVLAADVAGIVAASVMTVIAFYACQLLFESARLDFSGINARAIAMGIVMPLAWYAMLCAATSWIGRSYGAVLGFAWPIAILVGVLTLVHPSNLLALFIHDIAWVISRIDPLTYVSFASPNDDGTLDYADSNFGLRFLAEVLFFIVYGALAIIKWQRVEA